jgi:hypothetical protein
MRKLPPDSEVYALQQQGMTTREIADRYGTQRPAVATAIRRHLGTNRIGIRPKMAVDMRFVKVGAQPVEHRDTGEDKTFGEIIPVYKVRHTSLNDCRDLLREWGVGA